MANTYTISKIQLPNGDVCNIKDTTYSAGTGISLSGTTFSNSGVRAVSIGSTNGSLSVNTNGTSTNVFVKGMENSYLNIHPENTPILIPFIHNDIAFLSKQGGSVIVKYDNAVQTVDLINCFDGSGSYWAINPTNITTITIELTLHKTFTYTNIIYVDFGHANWRSKNIKIEVMNTNYENDVWTQKYSITTNSSGHIFVNMSHTPSGATNASGGFNKIRFTFSDWATATQFRLAQLGVYNYGSRGVRETYMSRGIDDYVFRNITPNNNNTYSLGSSSLKWANIYATTFTGNLTGNVTGDVSGTAANVTGTVAVGHGGTGATTASGARTNLGLGSIATYGAATSGTKDTWGLVPVIGSSDGVMEIGKYIDFHTTDGNTADYDVRITATTSGLTITGTTNGTFTGKYLATHTSGGQDEFRVIYGSTIDMAFMVGTGDENHGIYDHKASKWVLYAGTANAWYFNGNASTATEFSSGTTVKLTGDVTGESNSSKKGWSIATTIGTGKVTNAMLAGSIANGKLTNSKVTIAGNDVSLGGSLAADTLRSSLGLSNAMHFIGTTTTAMTDGRTTANVTVNDATHTPSNGDVVLYSDTEYVWTGSAWERLGRDSSFKTTQTAIADSTGTSESTTATRFVYSVSQDANGVISVKTRPLPTYNNYSLPLAASGTRGGVQIGYTTDATNKNYAVQLSSEKMYVNVPWTDTAVTSAANHYTPSRDTNADKTASASGATAAWSIDVVKGITLQTDGKGHITGVSVTSGKIPSNPNTDTKLTVAEVTSGTTYYPIVGTGTTAATRQYDTTGFVYKGTNGTTSAVGSAQLTLGNSIASGTANNKQGQLIIYGSTAYAHTISGAPTAARTLTLPDKTGTIALTSDLSDTKVTHTLGATTKYYITGTTSNATNTGGDTFDTGIYATTTAGELSALKYSIHDTSATPVEKVRMEWNSTDQSLDFIFT